MANFLRTAEGFDIYSSGNIATTNFPWYVVDATRTGNVTSAGGVFGGNALVFSGGTTTSTNGLDYQYATTANPSSSATSAGTKAMFGFGFWFNATAATAGTTQVLLQLGSSTTTGQYSMLGYTYAAGNLSLIFPTNTTFTTSPFSYPILTNAWYWIDIRWVVNSSPASWTYSYRVNDVEVATGTLTWGSNLIAAGNPWNRFRFNTNSQINYRIDDMVIRAVSNADTDYAIAGGTPALTDIPFMTARRIYAASATGNGTQNDWASSDGGTTPNWQAATDPTGVKYVVASDVNQTDLYKWSVSGSPTDIQGVVYRGASQKFSSVQPVKKVGSTVSNMTVGSGANRFIAVAENDGSSAWTSSSIAAAEFGQKSI